MKSGTYKVCFEIELSNSENEDEAVEGIKAMFTDLLDRGEFPEMELEFVEGTELEYTVEEDELAEVNFG